MDSQQGVAESGRHLSWATAICNHDQSSDLLTGSQLVSLLKALLFWACSSPLGDPCRQLHRRHVGVVGTVQGRDLDTSWHQAQLVTVASSELIDPEKEIYILSWYTDRPLFVTCDSEELSSASLCTLDVFNIYVLKYNTTQPLTFFCLLSLKPTKWLILHHVWQLGNSLIPQLNISSCNILFCLRVLW